MKTTKSIYLFLGVMLSLTFVCGGCGTKDVDPEAKVDAPGYYNGPMNPKGKTSTAPTGAASQKGGAASAADN